MQEIFIQLFCCCWFDKIYVKIIVNLTEISNCWLEIKFLRNGHYLGVCFNLLCSSQYLHNQPTGHGIWLQLIYKNHPVLQIRISEATNCKAKCKIDHNWEQIQAEIYVRSDREHFGLCETMTHCFFLLCCYHVNIFYVSGTIWAWSSGTRTLL